MKPFTEPKIPPPVNVIVIGLWAAVLLGIWIRIGLFSHSHDVFGTYADAGRKWTASQPLYSYTRGFVYSPLVAAFFAPFSWLPTSTGIGAVAAAERCDICRGNFLVAEGGDQQSHSEVILLAGFSPDSSAVTRQF